MEHRARKRFGQNFLNDGNIIRNIVAAIHPRTDDHMVEIGPGLGALTTPLLERLNQLHVVELDRDLIEKLPNLPHADRLKVHASDALKFSFSALAKELSDAPHSLRVVGNLPYNISSPLIFHLLDNSDVIQDMHFMLQKEVVERLCAQPATRDYGRLSVMVQTQCTVEHLFNVSKHCFTPAPKVESAIVRLTPFKHPALQTIRMETLESVVKIAFAQRRKTLRNNLKNTLSEAEIEACGINPSARPETLTVDEFIQLARHLETK